MSDARYSIHDVLAELEQSTMGLVVQLVRPSPESSFERQRRLEHDAVHEAQIDAMNDTDTARFAARNPTFRARLEEARKQRGLT